MLSINQLKKKYNGKKVIITGNTGFKGTYLSILLKYLGAKVYGYALKEEKGSLFDLLVNCEHVSKYLYDKQVYSDIRNFKSLSTYIKSIKPDYIVHMAAQPLVLKGIREPKYTYETNVNGTINLLESIRLLGDVKLSVLNVTTDKVYENNDLKNYAFVENDKLNGHDPYANSKSCSDIITQTYRSCYFKDTKISISIARAGNVIGGGDICENRIIPDCYRAIKNKKVLEIRNPNSIRPYEFVLEPLFMYLNILAKQYDSAKYIGDYNIGPDKKMCLTTKQLVTNFMKEWNRIDGSTIKIKMNAKTKNNKESKFLKLDNALIKKIYGYKEVYPLDKMIKYTALIYKQILYKKPILQNILAIINDYA